MKTILRNFFSVLRRFSLAAFLNVAGLAVAFATFYHYYDTDQLRT